MPDEKPAPAGFFMRLNSGSSGYVCKEIVVGHSAINRGVDAGQLPSYISLMDTTLRDGEQTQGVSFAAGEKLNIAQALLESLNVDRIEVASARVSAGEQDAVRAITSWAKEHG